MIAPGICKRCDQKNQGGNHDNGIKALPLLNVLCVILTCFTFPCWCSLPGLTCAYDLHTCCLCQHSMSGNRISKIPTLNYVDCSHKYLWVYQGEMLAHFCYVSYWKSLCMHLQCCWISFRHRLLDVILVLSSDVI